MKRVTLSANAFSQCGKNRTAHVLKKFSIFILKIKTHMKLMNMGLALLLTISGISVCKAQTADDVVNKYLDAIGGKDKLAKVKTKSVESTTQVMGNEGPSSINTIDGVGNKVVSEINGQTFMTVFTNKGGWQVNPYAGAATPTALPDELYKQGRSVLDINGPLYDYAAKGNKVELLGKDGNDYKLKVTTKDSVELTAYIDGTTYYLNKLVTTASMMGQTMEVTTTFSNFKKGDMDLVFPYTVEISYGGQFNITTTIKKIEINKTIDPAIFEMPKS
jgi:outer membrane lipoprotein-sorting protein